MKMKESKQSSQKSCFECYCENAKYLEDFHSFRHDFKNHLAALKLLLDSEQYQKASNYLASLEHMFCLSTNNVKRYSDNTLIDAIMQDMAHRCNKAQIAFSAEIITGESFPLSDTDICTLFTNLCNNAYEAQLNTDFPDKFISITSSLREKWFIINFENRFDGHTRLDSQNNIATTKEHPIYHGYGLKNTKKVVEAVKDAKLIIEPDFEEKIFRVTTVFPRNPH